MGTVKTKSEHDLANQCPESVNWLPTNSSLKATIKDQKSQELYEYYYEEIQYLGEIFNVGINADLKVYPAEVGDPNIPYGMRDEPEEEIIIEDVYMKWIAFGEYELDVYPNNPCYQPVLNIAITKAWEEYYDNR